jgi:hypothetical protein
MPTTASTGPRSHVRNMRAFTSALKMFLDLWWFVHPEYSGTDHQRRNVVHVYLTEGDRSEEMLHRETDSAYVLELSATR